MNIHTQQHTVIIPHRNPCFVLSKPRNEPGHQTQFLVEGKGYATYDIAEATRYQVDLYSEFFEIHTLMNRYQPDALYLLIDVKRVVGHTLHATWDGMEIEMDASNPYLSAYLQIKNDLPLAIHQHYQEGQKSFHLSVSYDSPVHDIPRSPTINLCFTANPSLAYDFPIPCSSKARSAAESMALYYLLGFQRRVTNHGKHTEWFRHFDHGELVVCEVKQGQPSHIRYSPRHGSPRETILMAPPPPKRRRKITEPQANTRRPQPLHTCDFVNPWEDHFPALIRFLHAILSPNAAKFQLADLFDDIFHQATPSD